MDKYRRLTLYTIYVCLIVCIVIYIVGYQVPLILIAPFLTAYWFLFSFIAVVIAIILFFMNKKWISEERVLALILLLPIVFTILVPITQRELRLRMATPTDALMTSYISDKYIYSNKAIDTSIPLINYNEDKKLLNVKIKISPNLFMGKQKDHMENNIDGDHASYFVNNIFLDYIDLMMNFTSVSKVPDKITVSGYWGEILILKAHYTREKKQYKLQEPYPEISLIGLDNRWYLNYNSNGTIERIIIREHQGPNFEKTLDRLIFSSLDISNN